MWNGFREARLSRFFILVMIVLPGVNSLGQQTPPPAAEPGIQDNSFLVEEAYNQNFAWCSTFPALLASGTAKTGITRLPRNGRFPVMNVISLATRWLFALRRLSWFRSWHR
jgi:hypothetical protein